MLSAYVLSVVFTSKDLDVTEEEFQELTAPCLTVLHSLKGAFDKKPCAYQYHPPQDSNGWSLRCALMISVGRERGEHLLELYRGLTELIGYHLPDFVVIRAEAEVLKFS